MKYTDSKEQIIQPYSKLIFSHPEFLRAQEQRRCLTQSQVHKYSQQDARTWKREGIGQSSSSTDCHDERSRILRAVIGRAECHVWVEVSCDWWTRVTVLIEMFRDWLILNLILITVFCDWSIRINCYGRGWFCF